MSGSSEQYSHTAYDDAFRTVESECDDALIAFINYIFHEDYDRTASVRHLRNEQYIEREGRADEKRITDSHFEITHQGSSKVYQIECESSGYSSTIIVRLFQYAVQTALDGHKLEADRIVIDMPQSGLVVLRDKGNPPDYVTIELHTPGGDLSYKAPVVCEADYELDEIFENKLYFLLPFYMFNYEKHFAEYDSDETGLNEFTEVYVDILKRLEHTDDADLSLRSKGVIIKQMESVTRRLAYKRDNISNRVGDIMGGKVLKMEWLEKYDAEVARGRARGLEEGRAEGRAEGREEMLTKQICRKLRKDKSIAQIADELEESESKIKEICEKAYAFAPDYDEEKVIEALRLNEVA